MSRSLTYPTDLEEIVAKAPALPFGSDKDGRVVSFDPLDEPNLVIDGFVSAGKSNAVAVLAASARAQSATVYGITPETAPSEDPMHVRAATMESAEDLLHHLHRDLRERLRLLDANGAARIDQLDDSICPERIFFFLDRLDQIVLEHAPAENRSDCEDEYRKYITDEIDHLAVEGPRAGVHVIVTTQHLEDTSLIFRDTAQRLHLDNRGSGVYADSAVQVWAATTEDV